MKERLSLWTNHALPSCDLETNCRGWCLYCAGKIAVTVGSGQFLTEDDLKGDLRFAELLADFIGSIKQVRFFESQHARLSQFLPPAVIEELREDDHEEVLQPKETDITVLFCDVRGFARKAELAQQNLTELLGRVSAALRIVTVAIVEYDGVIADFRADAALGFWGWPNPQPDGPLLAARAALEIQSEFEKARKNAGYPLADFHVGIGIADGRAIAGQIGNEEQSKVGVFGPAVELARRLQEMTIRLQAPIVMNEVTAEFVRENLSVVEGRCRDLGKLGAIGAAGGTIVTELLPPADQPGAISDETIKDFHCALDAFAERQRDDAAMLLDRLPSEHRTKDYILSFIGANDYQAPANWDGVIPIDIS